MDGAALSARHLAIDARERVWLSPPDPSGYEQQLVAEAIASNWIAPAGPALDMFEDAIADVTGIPHVLAVSSGTAALHLACHLAGVQPGDEVWTSTLTFVATISGACQLGARPRFFDVDSSSWTIDPALVEGALREAAQQNRLPKALIAVDLFGQPADIRRLGLSCARYGVALIADSAEGFGALQHGRHAGTGATATAFSFNGNKTITCGGGGALASDDAALIARARHLATQARQPTAHYEHAELGYNFRLSNVLAAVGRAQLIDLQRRVSRRREIFAHYVENLSDLPGIGFMPEPEWSCTSRWLSVLLIDSEAFGAGPDEVRQALEIANIDSRPVWKPMHCQPVFHDAPHVGGAVAENLFARGLCLPSGSGLTPAQQDRVIDVIRSGFARRC